MAHPYKSSKADKVGSAKAQSYMKGYASGGAVRAAYKLGGAVVERASGGEVKVQGRSTGGRLDKFARGGKVKKDKDTQINIAIVNPSKDSPPSAIGGPPGGLPPPPAGPPMPPMPPMAAGPPPMAGPAMMGPPPPKPPGMMARGGKVKGQKGGAETGQGRLDKVKMQKRK